MTLVMTQFAYLPKHLYSKYPLNTTNSYIILMSVGSFLIQNDFFGIVSTLDWFMLID